MSRGFHHGSQMPSINPPLSNYTCYLNNYKVNSSKAALEEIMEISAVFQSFSLKKHEPKTRSRRNVYLEKLPMHLLEATVYFCQ